MGITRFAVGRDRSFREVGQGFVLDQGLFESRFMSKTLKRDVFNSMQICRPYLCDVGAEYGSWAWSWFTFEGTSLASLTSAALKRGLYLNSDRFLEEHRLHKAIVLGEIRHGGLFCGLSYRKWSQVTKKELGRRDVNLVQRSKCALANFPQR